MAFKKLKKKLAESENIYYLRKWLLIGGLVGIVAGVGSIVFFESIGWAQSLFLGMGAGDHPPEPIGEGETVVTPIARYWMIPVVTTIGGLLSGLVVFKFAPEAEGHGTDHAIEAFHNKEGNVRGRIPVVKMIASAITIGSGGSAGREGPTAQIAAGFGSVLGSALKLPARDKRIAVAAGIGAGIGSIFKAPLGGALLSTEILYLDGFEVAALIPSFIASIIGYTIFAAWGGYEPVFGTHYGVVSHQPLSLVYYAILGIICGGVGLLYPRVFYGVRNLFRKLTMPDYLKPAVGGFGVGIIGMFLPQVLGMGYGWLQLNMSPETTLPVTLMLGLAFAKILTTSLSIGSGGSGGVFAPGLFIGGMLGASLWKSLDGVLPFVPASSLPFVVVGMMALFGGVARAPLAVMLMVSEMTGSYALLAPAMVAVGISYVIINNNTIYESQVQSPAHSPAHRYEFSLPLLTQLKVSDAMTREVEPVLEETPVAEAEEIIHENHVNSLPVVKRGAEAVVGMLSLEDILREANGGDKQMPVADIMSRDVVTTDAEETLDRVLDRLSQHDVGCLPVTEETDAGWRLVGIVSRTDVAQTYAKFATKILDTKGVSGGNFQPVKEEREDRHKDAIGNTLS